MLALGLDSEQIELARDAAAKFDDPAEAEDFIVWRENATIVQVFTDCTFAQQVMAGMSGGALIYTGISASEVGSVCDLHGIDAGTRREVLWGVRIMERVALPLMNQRR